MEQEKRERGCGLAGEYFQPPHVGQGEYGN